MDGEKLRKKWYIPAAAAVVAVFAVILVAVLAFRGGAETYRSIRIVEMEGGVTIERDGVGSLEASVNMNLISNDYVRTDADSYVVLRLDDDKYVMLGEQGAMQVQAEGSAESGRTAIHLESGSVLSEIQNPLSQDSSYEIITPSATMSVRGTVFEARKAPGDSFEVLVYEGTVAVGLGDLEPVLYTGGEYTQFTAGDAPQFLVERDIITEDRMNDQMLERLRQIEENGRALEFGEVQLDELIEERSSSEGRTEVADNSQVREPAASAEAPEPTAPAVQIPTEAPVASPVASPEPTASPEPAATRRPVVTAAPTVTTAPVVTAAPSVTAEPETSEPEWHPEPEPEPEPSIPPRPTFTPIPGETAKPADTPEPTWKPDPGTTPEPTKDPAFTEPPAVTPGPVNEQEWWTRADGQDNGSAIGEDGWKVVYFQPAIADIILKDGEDTKAVIGDQVPSGFRRETVKDNESLKMYYEQPDPVTVTIKKDIDGSGTPKTLEFVGWYYEVEEGEWEPWNFDMSPKSDLWLYAVWKDQEKNDNATYSYYFPRIWRDSVNGIYRCYSVREDIIEFIDKQTKEPLVWNANE